MPERTLVDVGARLAARGLAHGASGNLSIRLDDGSLLITPTRARLGALDADRLARLGADGRPIGGDDPSKEWPLHVAIYRVRSHARAIVHLHSRHAVAVACLDDLAPDDALPTYTAYQAMRVGRLRLVPFVPPGDAALGDAVAIAARDSRSLLLANHGLVAAGIDLEAASATAEEIEETCALHLLLGGRRVRLVPDDATARLRGDEPA
ncbi:MAG TPA: class II aldolase/adducin family protein [Candidatus Limnocylindrales bacterium]|nr:class II aldolase/adducin family protein [Candidatus Limnocylindrales bacterium]